MQGIQNGFEAVRQIGAQQATYCVLGGHSYISSETFIFRHFGGLIDQARENRNIMSRAENEDTDDSDCDSKSRGG